MTTTVTIDTHAGWPVEVVTTDKYGDNAPIESREVVPPGQTRAFYLTSNRSIAFHELRQEETSEEASE